MIIFIKSNYKYYLMNIFIIQIRGFFTMILIHQYCATIYHEVYLKCHLQKNPLKN
jgi:hypothetical protein